MPTQNEIHQQITNKIVDALKAGTPPWRKPWSGLVNTGYPANVISKRNYSGVNPLLLELVGHERGYQSRWWGTFRQWQSLGLRIKRRPEGVERGQWGVHVVFAKPVTKGVNQESAGKDTEAVEKAARFFVLRQYTVFNAEQVEGDGIKKFLAQPGSTNAVMDFEPAEKVIEATGADIRFGGGKAVYYPDDDYIQLPPKESFEGQAGYYSTAFHELAHWSGHQSRLDRQVRNRFGNAAYAMEELVAEIAGCYLCSEVGVPQGDDLSNQAAYLGTWLETLQGNPTSIFTAASQASQATDFILRFSRKDENGAETENEAEEPAITG